MAGVDTNGLAYQPKATPASSAKIYFDGIDCEPSSVKITCEASTADNSSAWKSVGTSAIGSITFGGTSFNGTTANSTGKTYTSFPRLILIARQVRFLRPLLRAISALSVGERTMFLTV